MIRPREESKEIGEEWSSRLLAGGEAEALRHIIAVGRFFERWRHLSFFLHYHQQIGTSKRHHLMDEVLRSPRECLFSRLVFLQTAFLG